MCYILSTGLGQPTNWLD
uniref:Uncharacterized protein n=1 Tax=Anguilla anguilla TaxID=7936 RepID=A0A0E9QG22_ANGAN